MSDILTKDMEMPKGCFMDCPVYLDDEEDWSFEGSGFCLLNKRKKVCACSYERDADCPLVEVKLHGRLIDADFVKDCLGVIKQEYPEAYKLIVGVIDRTPTVLEASNG